MAGKSAEELAKKQRDISIAEFFEKNRHLLGFDNPRRALMTGIKEAVDNALDACEEGRILPEVHVEIIQLSETRFRMIVEDNGPGIVKEQLPKIFAKLLYGSKFHKLSATRGQQGIGISATVLYGQLTTGKPATILSKTGKGKTAHLFKLKIDTQTNKPQVLEDKEEEWEEKNHGTRIEIDMEGSYTKGRQSVDEYIKETAIVNPHATIIYTNPEAEQIIFPRVTETLPPEPTEIKPHPYGIELGMLMKMLELTTSNTLQHFLMSEFVRVGSGTAKQICENSALLPKTKPKKVSREMVEQLYNGIQKTKIIAPPTDCISPIGAELLEKGLRKEINAEFYCSTTRPASVYRGNPFVVEAALAYGGEQSGDDAIRVMRFANRVPLLYLQGE
ncbi:MAG: DNA topoisomerase VI subunit B, partial [Nanoarchaeota archaeon]|nr:DNA topoisomerase VI subunit B [Nanoarchaeota archaeon]